MREPFFVHIIVVLLHPNDQTLIGDLGGLYCRSFRFSDEASLIVQDTSDTNKGKWNSYHKTIITRQCQFKAYSSMAGLAFVICSGIMALPIRCNFELTVKAELRKCSPGAFSSSLQLLIRNRTMSNVFLQEQNARYCVESSWTSTSCFQPTGLDERVQVE